MLQSEQSEQSQTQSNSILSNAPDKIEKYKTLLHQVSHFISSNETEKRIAFDFRILFKSAINETGNNVFLILNDALEHLICHFQKDYDKLINKKINWDLGYYGDYELLHDIAKVIMQTLLHKQNVLEFRTFCLQIN